ncbi:hypothetical protein Pcinc_032593 [Petrolisthes cinctipes]|uniref:Uncharacterized protein n=1 Tax=Petrolisthes cinctipes TaxID=88211 RepID=A0AAE1K152_PETCI|nr:hypothetical protein Pcinc_032593 [Petrolisthes cinctipes]
MEMGPSRLLPTVVPEFDRTFDSAGGGGEIQYSPTSIMDCIVRWEDSEGDSQAEIINIYEDALPDVVLPSDLDYAYGRSLFPRGPSPFLPSYSDTTHQDADPFVSNLEGLLEHFLSVPHPLQPGDFRSLWVSGALTHSVAIPQDDDVVNSAISQDDDGDSAISQPDDERDSVISQPDDGDSAMSLPDHGDSPISQPDDGDSPISQPDDGDSPISQPDDGDSPISQPDDGDSAMSQPDHGDSPISQPDHGDSPIFQDDDGDSLISQADVDRDSLIPQASHGLGKRKLTEECNLSDPACSSPAKVHKKEKEAKPLKRHELEDGTTNNEYPIEVHYQGSEETDHPRETASLGSAEENT